MIPVVVAGGRRLLVNAHLIESIEEHAIGSIVVTDKHRYRATNSAALLIAAIAATRSKARAIAREHLEPRRERLRGISIAEARVDEHWTLELRA